MVSVSFSEEAETEYIEALDWYSARSARAGTGFEAAIDETISRIAESPEQFPVTDQEGFRFAILNRYPYSLIYRITPSGVQIVAVAHARRKPGYWSRRV